VIGQSERLLLRGGSGLRSDFGSKIIGALLAMPSPTTIKRETHHRGLFGFKQLLNRLFAVLSPSQIPDRASVTSFRYF
jgi:hypothetical protein